MANRPIEQHEREMLVGAFLDIQIAQFMVWLESMTADEIDAIEGGDSLAAYIHQLRVSAVGGDPDPQQAIQSVALMADATLHRVITLVTGTDPLEA